MDWQGRDGRTLLFLVWMGGFRDSDAGWHIHGGRLRMSDETSSSLAAGQFCFDIWSPRRILPIPSFPSSPGSLPLQLIPTSKAYDVVPKSPARVVRSLIS